MTFNIVIKAETAAPVASIQKVGTELKNIEIYEAKANEAIKKGMAESSASAEKAKESVHMFGVELEGSITGSALGKFGELGSSMDSLISKGALESAALVGIGMEAIHLGDEYIQLTNNALRLAESQDKVGETLTQQMALSKQLHGSLEQTMELSTVVKERTEDMGLSQKQTAEFTRSLAEAVQLSGHSMGDATQVISRLGFALESGLPAGKAMKQLMMEFPEVGKAMSEGMHMSTKEIIEMAQKGHMSMKDFVDAMTEAGEDMESKFSHHVETTSQKVGHMGDQVKLTAGAIIASDKVTSSYGATTAGLASEMKNIVPILTATIVETAHYQELLKKFPELFGDGVHWATSFANAVHVGFQEASDATFAADVIRAPQAFTDALNTGLDQIVKLGGPQGIASLVKPLKETAEAWGFGAKAAHEHAAALSEGEKILERIRKPMQDQSAGIAELGKLYGNAKISLAEYTEELEKLYALHPPPVNSVTGGALQSAVPGVGQAAGMSAVPDSPSAHKVAQDAWSAEVVDSYNKRQAQDLTELWKKELADLNKETEQSVKYMAQAFKPLEAALTNMFETGKFDLDSFAKSMEATLTELAVKLLEYQVLKEVGASASTMAAFGFAHGGDFDVPGAANGANWTVGGYGGTDSKLAMFRVTPGEHVSVRTPEQMRSAQTPEASPVNVQITNQHDTRGELMASISGGDVDTHVLNLMKRNKTAIQTLLRK